MVGVYWQLWAFSFSCNYKGGLCRVVLLYYCGYLLSCEMVCCGYLGVRLFMCLLAALVGFVLIIALDLDFLLCRAFVGLLDLVLCWLIECLGSGIFTGGVWVFMRGLVIDYVR